ncbi:hypothetical protein GCM10009422_03960 [Brevundimonas kwangchunensis]|uniref:Surface-adhesin protein E-like domain-containing protein n=1 Tax=Brevundimonas kwangchunensis TaxID=322163 RepID=A0ABN1GII4_9CAUL
MKSAILGLAVLGAVAMPASAEDWHIYSRSQLNAFMAQVDSIATMDDVTSMTVAQVPRQGAAGNLGHTTELYQFRCAARQWRTAGQVEYGPNGAEMDRYPEDNAAWEPVRAQSIPEQLMGIACEGARANPPTWPTIRAWIDAGRP